jgi:cytochrome c oxidase subunit II
MSSGPILAFDPHSPQAQAISSLFTQTLLVCAVIGAIVSLLVGVCVVRFRASRRPTEPPQTHGHTMLEIGWTVVPLVIVVGLVILSAQAMAASDPAPSREADVVVVGHQWWWEVRYPSGAITANELHVPAGKDVLVRVESADVIHDFWVPQLGRKIDAIPGHPSFIWLQADTPGTYLGACAEYCGSEHAWMRILVVADPPDTYAAWAQHELESAPAPVSEAEVRGLSTFRTRTCIKCHAIAGVADASSVWMASVPPARVAPDLTHLAERKTLGAGVLDNDPVRLARWLHEPDVVKPASHMPNLNLTDEEVSDLVAYFETLR